MFTQRAVLEWVKNTFGIGVASSKEERLKRFLEEVLELNQACGMPYHDVMKIIDYVYTRPEGDIKQEMGGVIVTLYALAEVLDINAMDCGILEFDRVVSVNPRILQEKQHQKYLKGVGLV